MSHSHSGEQDQTNFNARLIVLADSAYNLDVSGILKDVSKVMFILFKMSYL